MQNKPLKYFISTVFLILVLAAYQYSVSPSDSLERPDVVLSEQRAVHILYGDETAGGHKFGAGVPCKSEFPESWDDTKILETTKRIAANDNARWRQEDNGYFVTETMEDGVKVRVVLGPKKQNIITSYPLNQPRNPCPYKRPMNDNTGNR